jgi:benzoate-CoA ligase
MSNNFAKFIIDSNRGRHDKIAIVDELKSLTYKDLETHILWFSNHLRQSLVKPQDRVIICMEDCIEWPVAFLSVVAVGGNPVLVNNNSPISDIEKISKLADAKFVIGQEIAGLKFFSKKNILEKHENTSHYFYQYHDDEMCFWLLTSGTTGESKCIVHRHNDLKTLLELIAGPAYQVDEHSRILSTAKLSFGYGFANSLVFALGKGATAFLISGMPAPRVLFKNLDINSITHFFTVPTIINSMIKHGRGKKISTVKVMVSSGEPLSSHLAKKFQDQHGILVLDGIGMSENWYNYCTTTPNDYSLGTIGKPVPGVECSVRDDQGNELPTGEIGEMWVKHPCAAIQYWKNWKDTKLTFIGEWIKTGDKVIKQQNGHYKYVSRKDDLLKVSGQWVSPIEIENTIMSIEGISECAVVHKITDTGLIEIHAFISFKKIISESDIKMHLKKYLPSYKIPKYIHQISSLPKTVNLKKNRTKLREMLKIG